MSQVFFEQLGLPVPDFNLDVGSSSHATQTAQIMIRFEKVVIEQKPDLVLVYGDVNSTVACALVAAKLGIAVGHVEAGLRSFDRTMPEEINRVLADRICDMLFTPSRDGDDNLLNEGVPKEKIFRVGNVMIDTLVRLLDRANSPQIDGLSEKYVLVTMHRPSNTDDVSHLLDVMNTLKALSRDIQIVFPMHPRTRKYLTDSGFDFSANKQFLLEEPIGYLEFLYLQKHACAVITDSGGVQEETTFLGVPCLTLRENTERPVTVTEGTNQLIGHDMAKLRAEMKRILEGKVKTGKVPELWDGAAAERIAALIV